MNKRDLDYFRLIQENYFPDLSLSEIQERYDLYLLRQMVGYEDESGEDIMWRNPSP